MKWARVMLMLCLLGLTACAARVEYLRGDSRVIPLEQGQTVEIPAGWSGAWMISDQALADLLQRCEASAAKGGP